MNIKKIIATILLIVFCNMNIAYAENWVTICAENGKTADLDLDSIEVTLDTVEYNIRTINDDITYINRFSTDLYKEGTPTAVIKTTKYLNGKEVSSEIKKNIKYRELKSGTLQAEIYDVISKKINEEDFDEGKKVWDKYLKRQRKILYKNWDSWYDCSHVAPYYGKYTITVYRDGRIVQDSEDFTCSYIEPLPGSYAADTFTIDAYITVHKFCGAKKEVKKPYVQKTSPTTAKMKFASNNFPPVIGHIIGGYISFLNFCATGNGLPDLPGVLGVLYVLFIPFALLTIPLVVIFFLFGGDKSDLAW